MVIDLFNPGPQSGIQVGQVCDTALVEFAEKLVSKRAVPALQFALALGRVGSAKNQMDVQPRAHALQGGSTVGGPIVDNNFYGHATAQQGLLEHPLDIERRLAQAERAVRHQARGIIDQGHQIGLAQLPLDRQAGAVHHIAIPNRACKLGTEAALLFGQTR